MSCTLQRLNFCNAVFRYSRIQFPMAPLHPPDRLLHSTTLYLCSTFLPSSSRVSTTNVNLFRRTLRRRRAIAEVMIYESFGEQEQLYKYFITENLDTLLLPSISQLINLAPIQTGCPSCPASA